MKSFITLFLLGISVFMSLSGAVNSGWTYFVCAIPFMAYVLGYVFIKKEVKGIAVGILFIILCITISLTRDKNPILYPIVRGGQVTVLRDMPHLGMNKGDTYNVLHVIHEGSITLPSYVTVVTDKDHDKAEMYRSNTTFTATDFDRAWQMQAGNLDGPYVSINKPIEAPWAAYMGHFMNWPSFFFMWLFGALSQDTSH